MTLPPMAALPFLGRVVREASEAERVMASVDAIVRATGLPHEHVAKSLAKSLHTPPHPMSPLHALNRQENTMPITRTDDAEVTLTHWMHPEGSDSPVEARITVRVEAPHHAAMLLNAATMGADSALRATSTDYPGEPETGHRHLPTPVGTCGDPSCASGTCQAEAEQETIGWRGGACRLRDNTDLLWVLGADGWWRSDHPSTMTAFGSLGALHAARGDLVAVP